MTAPHQTLALCQHGGGEGLCVSPDGPSPAAASMRAPAHPQPGGSRHVRVIRTGSSHAATRAANSLAAVPPDAAVGAFWDYVVSGRIRLTPAEDRMVWDLRAVHWRWDLIARAILERRSHLRKRIRAAAGHRMLAAYRRQREALRGP